MRRNYVALFALLSIGLTLPACQGEEPVSGVDRRTEPLPFAHSSFTEMLLDPGAFHNEVVVAYFDRRDGGFEVVGGDVFVHTMTAAVNEVLALRGRPVPVREDDIAVLYDFFVDLRDAGVYNVFDVTESPSRLVAYLQDAGSLPERAADAIQFYLRHRADPAYADPDPVLLADATLSISSDLSVRTFLAVERASTELLATLPLPVPARRKDGAIAMTRATAIGIVDAVAALSFAEFGPYATIIAGTIASSLYREALGDEEPLGWGEWPGPCIPCH